MADRAAYDVEAPRSPTHTALWESEPLVAGVSHHDGIASVKHVLTDAGVDPGVQDGAAGPGGGAAAASAAHDSLDGRRGRGGHGHEDALGHVTVNADVDAPTQDPAPRTRAFTHEMSLWRRHGARVCRLFLAHAGRVAAAEAARHAARDRDDRTAAGLQLRGADDAAATKPVAGAAAGVAPQPVLGPADQMEAELKGTATLASVASEGVAGMTWAGMGGRGMLRVGRWTWLQQPARDATAAAERAASVRASRGPKDDTGGATAAVMDGDAVLFDIATTETLERVVHQWFPDSTVRRWAAENADLVSASESGGLGAGGSLSEAGGVPSDAAATASALASDTSCGCLLPALCCAHAHLRRALDDFAAIDDDADRVLGDEDCAQFMAAVGVVPMPHRVYECVQPDHVDRNVFLDIVASSSRNSSPALASGSSWTSDSARGASTPTRFAAPASPIGAESPLAGAADPVDDDDTEWFWTVGDNDEGVRAEQARASHEARVTVKKGLVLDSRQRRHLQELFTADRCAAYRAHQTSRKPSHEAQSERRAERQMMAFVIAAWCLCPFALLLPAVDLATRFGDYAAYVRVLTVKVYAPMWTLAVAVATLHVLVTVDKESDEVPGDAAGADVDWTAAAVPAVLHLCAILINAKGLLVFSTQTYYEELSGNGGEVRTLLRVVMAQRVTPVGARSLEPQVKSGADLLGHLVLLRTSPCTFLTIEARTDPMAAPSWMTQLSDLEFNLKSFNLLFSKHKHVPSVAIMLLAHGLLGGAETSAVGGDNPPPFWDATGNGFAGDAWRAWLNAAVIGVMFGLFIEACNRGGVVYSTSSLQTTRTLVQRFNEACLTTGPLSKLVVETWEPGRVVRVDLGCNMAGLRTFWAMRQLLVKYSSNLMRDLPNWAWGSVLLSITSATVLIVRMLTSVGAGGVVRITELDVAAAWLFLLPTYCLAKTVSAAAAIDRLLKGMHVQFLQQAQRRLLLHSSHAPVAPGPDRAGGGSSGGGAAVNAGSRFQHGSSSAASMSAAVSPTVRRALSLMHTYEAAVTHGLVPSASVRLFGFGISAVMQRAVLLAASAGFSLFLRLVLMITSSTASRA